MHVVPPSGENREEEGHVSGSSYETKTSEAFTIRKESRGNVTRDMRRGHIELAAKKK